MNIQFNYYNFEKLTDKERGDFITYILDECKEQIYFYQRKLGENYEEDFRQETSLLLLCIINNKNFKFIFFKSFNDYGKNLFNNKDINIKFILYYLRENYSTYYLIHPQEKKKSILFSKKFYKEIKDYSFKCSFLSYIKKAIKNKWIQCSKNKDKHNVVHFSNEIINNVKCYDENIEFISMSTYLSDDDFEFLQLSIQKTQSEIAKEFHTTQQSISYRLKKIRKKLKEYEKL